MAGVDQHSVGYNLIFSAQSVQGFTTVFIFNLFVLVTPPIEATIILAMTFGQKSSSIRSIVQLTRRETIDAFFAWI